MGAEDKFIEELAKQLPVKAAYKDIARPAARQTGQLAEDLIKVLHLALAPVQFAAAVQDRYRRFLDNSIRRVPEERQIAPPPQILGPVLEGVRYEPEGTPVDELFSQLLSRAMDLNRVDEAHPSFPYIIKQLSADEAQILSRLDGREYDYVLTKPLDRSNMLFGAATVEVDDLPRDQLLFPENVTFYMEHLDHLGLAKIVQQGNQVPLHGGLTPKPGGTVSLGPQTGVRIIAKYTLTDFGRRFVRACRP